jgi:hypothetical protein
MPDDVFTRAGHNIGVVLRAGVEKPEPLLSKIGIELVNRIRVILSQPGSGRTYARRGVVHAASAPGEPPATDTGKYKTSWDWRIDGSVLSVGTPDVRGCLLGSHHHRVTTTRGSVPIGQIAAGDRVLTQTGEWRTVVGTSRYKASEKPSMVTLRVQESERVQHRLELTHDHRVLVGRDDHNAWIPAGQLRVGDNAYIRVRRPTNQVHWSCVNCGGPRRYHQGRAQRFCSTSCRTTFYCRTGTNPSIGTRRTSAARLKMRLRALAKLKARPELHPSRLVAARGYQTSYESQVEKWLDARGVNYEKQVPIGSWIVDFLLVDRLEIIEADGAYWHQDQARDLVRDAGLLAALPGARITHLHFHDPRFTPNLDPEPMPGVTYVICNPGPSSYVDGTEFRPASVVDVEAWTYEPSSHPRASDNAMLYDISVEGVHSFLANGVLISNSWLEFGTSRMAPRPHLRPVVEGAREKITELFAKGIAEIQERTIRTLRA